MERRGNFTPIVLSVDGLLHREAEHFLKRMAANLAHKWEKAYSQTCGYVRARLAFAIIRATSLCLRGSRVKWRSELGMDDGAPLYSIGNPNPVLQKEVSRLGKKEKKEVTNDAGITVQISTEEGIAMKASLGIPWSKIQILRR